MDSLCNISSQILRFPLGTTPFLNAIIVTLCQFVSEIVDPFFFFLWILLFSSFIIIIIVIFIQIYPIDTHPVSDLYHELESPSV